MMFGVIGIPLKKSSWVLSATEFGLLTATPVLTGSLIRVPLGIWTDRYGGRIVMALLMAATVPAIWLMSYATAYWHFLVIGLFVGLAGGSFSVARPMWRAGSRRPPGMAMGVYGAGNPVRPSTSSPRRRLLAIGGWTLVPQVYAAIMLGTVILFWLGSSSDPEAPGAVEREVHRPAKMLKDPAEVPPVLQHRLRRLRGAGPVDGAVLRGRVRPVDPDRRAAGGLLQRCRAACCVPSAASCPTSSARTRSRGGCSG